MQPTRRSTALATLLAGAWLAVSGTFAPPASAADFSDPTWPCVQRKVENLSVGLMWPHPIPEQELPAAEKKALHDLAGRFALRRLDIEELRPMLADFVADYGNDEGLLGLLFDDTFNRLARTRSTIMHGIEEYSLEQIAMSERIDKARAEMDRIMDLEEPDFDKVDALEEQVDWDQRIYTDRQKSLTYVCETPVLIEKRLYAIAQMLLEAAKG